jgi:hypothetical protein
MQYEQINALDAEKFRRLTNWCQMTISDLVEQV